MNNYGRIKKSFAKQAENFATYHMSKSEYTDYLIERIKAVGSEHTLEVAAGTCICGRALAPYVKDVICLDLTEEMLEQGKNLAKKNNIKNIFFVAGNAMELPYDDSSFDLVITRLSFHHFTEPQKLFNEMKRVLKNGGKLVVWDMEAVEDKLRETCDTIEKMRDDSHVRILSQDEFLTLYNDEFNLQVKETIFVPVNLQNWMELTDTPMTTQKNIVKLMTDDINGDKKTGFRPYFKDGQIWFEHKWLLLIGIKNSD